MQKALRTTALQSQSRSLHARTQRGCAVPRAQLPSAETAAQKEQPSLAIATFLASGLLVVASATPALASEELVATVSTPTSDLSTIVAEGVDLSISTQAPAIEVAEAPLSIPDATLFEPLAVATITPPALSYTADAAIPEEQPLPIPDPETLTVAESAPVLAAAAVEEPLVAATISSESSPSATDETIAAAPSTETTPAAQDGPVDAPLAVADADPVVQVEDVVVEAVTPVGLVTDEPVTPEVAAVEVAPVEAAPIAVEVEAEAAAVPAVVEDEVPAAAVAAVVAEEEVTPVPVAASLDEAVELPDIIAADIEVPAQLPAAALPEAVDVVPVVTDAATEAVPVPVSAPIDGAATAAEDAASAGSSFDLPALFAAASVSGGSSTTSTSEGPSAESLTYGALGAAAVSFIGTFFVAPRFKESFKEPVDWRDMYAALVAKGVKTVTVEEAYAKAKKGAVLLDVRLASKFDSLSAVPSINVQLYQPIAGWDAASNIRRAGFAFFGIFGTELNENFAAEVAAKVPKNKEVIVMCESGGTIENKPGTQFGFQSRSLKALYYLQQAGYPKVFHVKGGLGDWQRAGLPTSDGATESPAALQKGTTAGSSSNGRGTSASNGKATVAGKAGTTAGKATARELVSATSSSRSRK